MVGIEDERTVVAIIRKAVAVGVETGDGREAIGAVSAAISIIVAVVALVVIAGRGATDISRKVSELVVVVVAVVTALRHVDIRPAVVADVDESGAALVPVIVGNRKPFGGAPVALVCATITIVAVPVVALLAWLDDGVTAGCRWRDDAAAARVKEAFVRRPGREARQDAALELIERGAVPDGAPAIAVALLILIDGVVAAEATWDAASTLRDVDETGRRVAGQKAAGEGIKAAAAESCKVRCAIQEVALLAWSNGAVAARRTGRCIDAAAVAGVDVARSRSGAPWNACRAADILIWWTGETGTETVSAVSAGDLLLVRHWTNAELLLEEAVAANAVVNCDRGTARNLREAIAKVVVRVVAVHRQREESNDAVGEVVAAVAVGAARRAARVISIDESVAVIVEVVPAVLRRVWMDVPVVVVAVERSAATLLLRIGVSVSVNTEWTRRIIPTVLRAERISTLLVRIDEIATDASRGHAVRIVIAIVSARRRRSADDLRPGTKSAARILI